jgi:hypothetical protein
MILKNYLIMMMLVKKIKDYYIKKIDFIYIYYFINLIKIYLKNYKNGIR